MEELPDNLKQLRALHYFEFWMEQGGQDCIEVKCPRCEGEPVGYENGDCRIDHCPICDGCKLCKGDGKVPKQVAEWYKNVHLSKQKAKNTSI